MKLGKLILSRHGESVFNARSLWTGIWDVPLTRRGRQEAKIMGEAISRYHPDVAYTSALIRASDTLKIILKTNHWNIPVHQTKKLNERDYGDLTGLNKWEVETKYGDKQFTLWRRGWDAPVPDGETLKDVYARVIPFFQKTILPKLTSGQDVLITAHGNTLRALLKYLNKLSDQDVEKLEMPFGEIIIFDFESTGNITSQEKIIHIKLPPMEATT